MDFTSERKAMSTIISGYKNKSDILLKGAPDRILKKCSSYYMFGGLDGPTSLNDSQRDQILDQVSTLAKQGLRCLAIAEIPNTGPLAGIS